MIKFSTTIISHNVARTIRPCLAALKKVSNEIIVLDSFSDDGTVEICKEMGVKLVPQEWLGYSQTKNLGNEMAINDWILSIDADEVLDDKLIVSLKNLDPKKGNVYAVNRLTNFGGKWIYHCGWHPEWKIRLFNRKDVVWQGDFVHETLTIPADFQTVKLEGELLHYSFKDREDYVFRQKKYARLAAEEMFKNGKQVNFIKKYFGSVFRFFKTYIFQLGFLDGKEGWIISKHSANMVKERYKILENLKSKAKNH